MTKKFPLRHLPLLLLPLLLGWPGSAVVAQTVPGVSSDQGPVRDEFTAEVMRSVHEVTSAWKRAWETADLEALVDAYDEDAVMRFPGGERLVGRDEVSQALRAGSLPVGGSIVTRQLDLVASGRMAVTSGRFEAEFEREGRLEQESGSYVAVFLRDGRDWRIRSQHFHEDGEGIGGAGNLL